MTLKNLACETQAPGQRKGASNVLSLREPFHRDIGIRESPDVDAPVVANGLKKASRLTSLRAMYVCQTTNRASECYSREVLRKFVTFHHAEVRSEIPRVNEHSVVAMRGTLS